MKKQMWVLALAMAILASCGTSPSDLQNGDAEGNGGDVVICKRDGKDTIELLDYYEMRVMMADMVPDLGPKEWSPDKKVKHVLERLRRIDPFRADEFAVEAGKFDKFAYFFDQDLADVPDHGHVVLEPGCHIEQIAIFFPEAMPSEKRFQINTRLWNRLDNDHKAGLMLHEVIYRYARLKEGHPNSKRARYFHESLSDLDIERFSQRDYFQLLRAVGFRSFRYNEQITIPTDDMESVRFWEGGALKRVRFPFSPNTYQEFQFGKQRLILSNSDVLGVTPAKCKDRHYYFGFNESGKLDALEALCDRSLNPEGYILKVGDTTFYTYDILRYHMHENGEPKYVLIDQPGAFVGIVKQGIKFDAPQALAFDQNGRVICAGVPNYSVGQLVTKQGLVHFTGPVHFDAEDFAFQTGEPCGPPGYPET